MNSNEELARIRKAKKHWQLVRRKKRVILMMSKLGEGAIYELDQRRFIENKQNDEDEQYFNSESRFIINPKNFYKIKWNHLVCITFIFWIFALPIWVS